MRKIISIGLDLAKNVFQVHGADERGRTVLVKTLSRAKVIQFFANLPACLVGMEACSGSHHWAREIESLGHTVRLISPQYVKPFVKTNKNDRNDAEAICEALNRPNMRFVPPKNQEQQDIQALHRIRQRFVEQRTAVANQIRGFLAEHGVVIPQGIRKLRQLLPYVLLDFENSLTAMSRDYISDLCEEIGRLDEKIKAYEHRLEAVAKAVDACQRLQRIPGIGLMNATALYAAVGRAETFKCGRQFAAWLGLVPRQHSSGGKTKLLGISKRGDTYLRTLLIHGARAFIGHWATKDGERCSWINEVTARRGLNRAIVAQANKTARIAWAVLARAEEYKAAA